MGVDVGAARDAAGAAGQQVPDDELVVAGQGGEGAVLLALARVDVGQDVGEVARRVLGAHDVVDLGQPGHGGGGQGVAGAGGDVVQDDGHIHRLGHGLVVLVQLVLAGGGKAGGDDGQHVRAQRLGHLALLDGLPGGDAAGAGIDGHAAVAFLDDGPQHQFLFLAVEDVALAVGAKAEDGVDAALDLAVDLGPQLGDVDGLVVVHRGDNRGDDAFDFNSLHGSISFTSFFDGKRTLT